MAPTKRKFYVITAAVLLTIVLFAGVMIVYTDRSYVKIEFRGSDRAYFTLSYDSTNATIPTSQNLTVGVLPHANITIAAHPDPQFVVISWNVTGAQILRTGNGTINLMTGNGGDIIKVSAVFAAKTSGSP